jgi:hypothetical protein
VVGCIACLTALAALLWQTATTHASRIWILVLLVGLAVVIETAYRGITRRTIRVAGAAGRS